MHALSFIAILIFLMPTSATAQVFKCVDNATGKVVYSGIPCPTSAQGDSVKLWNNTLDASGSREQALRHEVRELKAQLQAAQQNNALAQEVAELEAQELASKRPSDAECERARRTYEIERQTLVRNSRWMDEKTKSLLIPCGIIKRSNAHHSSVEHRPPPPPRPPSPPLHRQDVHGNVYIHTGGPFYQPVTGGPPCEALGSVLHCQ